MVNEALPRRRPFEREKDYVLRLHRWFHDNAIELQFSPDATYSDVLVTAARQPGGLLHSRYQPRSEINKLLSVGTSSSPEPNDALIVLLTLIELYREVEKASRSRKVKDACLSVLSNPLLNGRANPLYCGTTSWRREKLSRDFNRLHYAKRNAAGGDIEAAKRAKLIDDDGNIIVKKQELYANVRPKTVGSRCPTEPRGADRSHGLVVREMLLSRIVGRPVNNTGHHLAQ
jgi:hypothetical protein